MLDPGGCRVEAMIGLLVINPLVYKDAVAQIGNTAAKTMPGLLSQQQTLGTAVTCRMSVGSRINFPFPLIRGLT